VPTAYLVEGRGWREEKEKEGECEVTEVFTNYTALGSLALAH
jgi:hypothetical protein